MRPRTIPQTTIDAMRAETELTYREISEKYAISFALASGIMSNQIYHSAMYVLKPRIRGRRKVEIGQIKSVGLKDGRRKLTNSQIKRIITSKKTQAELASIYGVTQPAISYYKRKMLQIA